MWACLPSPWVSTWEGGCWIVLEGRPPPPSCRQPCRTALWPPRWQGMLTGLFLLVQFEACGGINVVLMRIFLI